MNVIWLFHKPKFYGSTNEILLKIIELIQVTLPSSPQSLHCRFRSSISTTPSCCNRSFKFDNTRVQVRLEILFCQFLVVLLIFFLNPGYPCICLELVRARFRQVSCPYTLQLLFTFLQFPFIFFDYITNMPLNLREKTIHRIV